MAKSIKEKKKKQGKNSLKFTKKNFHSLYFCERGLMEKKNERWKQFYPINSDLVNFNLT